MSNDQKKKVCIFTIYNAFGASSNYRILQYIDDLKNIFHIKTFHFWDDKYIKYYIWSKEKHRVQIFYLYFKGVIKRILQLIFVASNAEIVYFQKSCIPKSSLTFIRYLRKKNIRIIFDVDDAVYLLNNDNSDLIAKHADVVICGNVILKEYYEKINKNAIVIPTIDRNVQYQYNKKDTFKNKTVGWIGSSTTIKNLDIIIKPINNLVKRHPDLNFIIISDSSCGYESRIKNCVFYEWNKENYVGMLKDITIGIMPLYDTPVNRGKCGFKLIQYLNLEKPVVASDVGINIDIVKSSGYVVKNNSDWELNIEKLLYDKKTYDQCVMNIRDVFEKEYGYHVIINQIKKYIGEDFYI